jgi:hypothetical protein
MQSLSSVSELSGWTPRLRSKPSRTFDASRFTLDALSAEAYTRRSYGNAGVFCDLRVFVFG